MAIKDDIVKIRDNVWETKYHRASDFDWCILALGHSGHIGKIDIDTAHFKGNYPAEVSIQAIYIEDATDPQLIPQSMFWPFLLGKLANQLNYFTYSKGI